MLFHQQRNPVNIHPFVLLKNPFSIIPKQYRLFYVHYVQIICGYPDKNKRYGNNVIKTTRYSLLNIVPLYLWDVFNPKHKLANVFFLLVSILQCIPSISLTNGLPSSLPSLLTIIGAEAVHMGILEYKRRKSDKETNNRSILIWNMETDTWNQKQWKDIHVLLFPWYYV